MRHTGRVRMLLFQKAGPEYENARSSLLRRRAGSAYLLLADERSRLWLDMFAIGERVSIM